LYVLFCEENHTNERDMRFPIQKGLA